MVRWRAFWGGKERAAAIEERSVSSWSTHLGNSRGLGCVNKFCPCPPWQPDRPKARASRLERRLKTNGSGVTIPLWPQAAEPCDHLGPSS